MNHIQRTTAHPASDSYSVEFYPSTDDYVHIALKTSASVPTPALIKIGYKAFLIINAVGFPTFLWLNEFFLAGFLLFGLNLVALAWVIPWFAAGGLRRYYEHTVGSREKHVARVDLTPEGINYSADDAELFWPWRRITSIEETDESIYFYFPGNGIAVRKSGFAYHEEQVEFLKAAHGFLSSSRRERLEQ